MVTCVSGTVAAGPEGTDVWATEHGYAAVTPLRAGELYAATFAAWKDKMPR